MAQKSSKKGSRSQGKMSGRPQPLVPRAGFRVDGARYGKGGKLCK